MLLFVFINQGQSTQLFDINIETLTSKCISSDVILIFYKISSAIGTTPVFIFHVNILSLFNVLDDKTFRRTAGRHGL